MLDIFIYVCIILFGVFLVRKKLFPEKLLKKVSLLQSLSLYLLLGAMGYKIGSDDRLISSAVIVGILLGYFTKSYINFDISLLIQFGLYLLLFFIGIDIGKNDNILNDLKKLNKKVLFLPFITIISSLAGGAVASILLSLSVGESVAISAGMGWYSFSAIELSKVSVELGGIAFLSNIFRELLAIFLIPIIAKKIGSFESVSVAGATAMDSVLPIINKSNPAEISIISFYSGLVISIIVPILIPILVNIFSL